MQWSAILKFEIHFKKKLIVIDSSMYEVHGSECKLKIKVQGVI